MSDDDGITQRCVYELFAKIAAAKDDNEKHFSVQVSFLQIYNEKVYDLLNPSTAGNMDPSKRGTRGDKIDKMNDGLRIRWTKKEQFVVENLYICEVNSAKEVLDLFKYGSRNRVLAAT
jgi:hypothetical protein